MKDSATKLKIEWLYIDRCMYAVVAFLVSMFVFWQLHNLTIQYIYDEPGKKMITLVTCASGEDGEVDRTIIQGELAEVLDATKENLKYFN